MKKRRVFFGEEEKEAGFGHDDDDGGHSIMDEVEQDITGFTPLYAVSQVGLLETKLLVALVALVILLVTHQYVLVRILVNPVPWPRASEGSESLGCCLHSGLRGAVRAAVRRLDGLLPRWVRLVLRPGETVQLAPAAHDCRDGLPVRKR